MNLFSLRRKRRDGIDAAHLELQEVRRAAEELERRVRRLERESEVFVLQRKRELRGRGIHC